MITYNKPERVGSTGESTRTFLVFSPVDGSVDVHMNGWRERSGGKASSELTTIQGDEYQGPFIIGGNNVTYDDVTATTFVRQTDFARCFSELRARLGYTCHFIEHLTENGQPVQGPAITYKGKLKEVEIADSGDRKSTDPNTIKITMEVSEVV